MPVRVALHGRLLQGLLRLVRRVRDLAIVRYINHQEGEGTVLNLSRTPFLKKLNPPLSRPMKLGMTTGNHDSLCLPKSVDGTGKRPKIMRPTTELNRRSVHSKLKMQPWDMFIDNLMLLAPAWIRR